MADEGYTYAWRTGGFVALLLTAAAVAVAAAAGAGQEPVQLFRVASGSMRPTLAVGQMVHVDASAYASSPPQTGDIVAFHAPAGATGDTPVCGAAQGAGQVCVRSTAAKSDQIFIKRVVAGPGDTVAVVGGWVVRNGVREREPFDAACDTAACNYSVSIQVPDGDWFLMGDDRPASDDSRYWGPVPQAWIIGKVVK